MGFYCNPIRQKDENGQLIRAGVTFVQGSSSVGHNLSTMGCALVVAVGVTIVGFLLVPYAPLPGGGILLAGLAFGAFMVWGLVKSAPNERTLVFSRDNRLYDQTGKYYTEWTPQNIDSIEARQDHRDKDPAMNPNFPVSHVAVTNDDGQVGKVAVNLHWDHAIQVARQLQKALLEMRASMAVTYRREDNTLHVTIGDLDQEDPLPSPPRDPNKDIG